MLTMVGEKREISKNSLANLRLGGESRRLGKVRCNFSILPETSQWLKATGNASDCIDALVEAVKKGGLTSINTHQWKDQEQITPSNDVYDEIEALKLEVEVLRSQLEKSCQQEKSYAGMPDMDATRDRILQNLKLGKQAPEYKRTKSLLNKFIAELRSPEP